MCRGSEHVSAEAGPLLAEVLGEIASVLSGGHPELVVIGPVDFGPAPE